MASLKLSARMYDDGAHAPAPWVAKAFADPSRAARLLNGVIRTPCDAAWRVGDCRLSVYRWLEAGEDAGLRLVFVVMMPEKTQRDAVFVRRRIEYASNAYAAAACSLSATVYATRPWH